MAKYEERASGSFDSEAENRKERASGSFTRGFLGKIGVDGAIKKPLCSGLCCISDKRFC